ncbi:unnamed protein product [Boreogadus saida]
MERQRDFLLTAASLSLQPGAVRHLAADRRDAALTTLKDGGKESAARWEREAPGRETRISWCLRAALQVFVGAGAAAVLQVDASPRSLLQPQSVFKIACDEPITRSNGRDEGHEPLEFLRWTQWPPLVTAGCHRITANHRPPHNTSCQSSSSEPTREDLREANWCGCKSPGGMCGRSRRGGAESEVRPS